MKSNRSVRKFFFGAGRSFREQEDPEKHLCDLHTSFQLHSVFTLL